MSKEKSTVNAEQLNWERQLSNAVDMRVDELTRGGARPASRNNSGFSLVAPNGAQIRLNALPTLDHPRLYMPGRSVLLDLGDEDKSVPLMPGIKYNSENGSYFSKYRKDFPLEFTIDTRASLSLFSREFEGYLYAVATSGEVTGPRLDGTDVHYEAFAEYSGTYVYKLGEDKQLLPVDEIEGGRLLWLMSNSSPLGPVAHDASPA